MNQNFHTQKNNLNLYNLKPEEFPAVYALMQASFPPAEFRSYEAALALFEQSAYQVLTAKQEETGMIQAFIAEWTFEDFHYAEHFAVNPELRGNGLGSKMMNAYLKQVNSPVVIEVEAADSPEAIRRIGFYERLGFCLSDVYFMQPKLQPDTKDVMLRLMHYPASISADALLRMKDDIFKTVYQL
ncbi:GNAT family N-acetyltransferase [Konateibacter massiliensis]|uniref:GNAT family N-acetyltransferase n=1 Tax=Konateibacter massiliensis TaxID=2002841 RepID=UPI000C146957|nr:GNAT family N-acetyltransferase [Konateibacter massiliensis]